MERTFVLPPSASLEEKQKGKTLGFTTRIHEMGGEGWAGKGRHHEPLQPVQSGDTCPRLPWITHQGCAGTHAVSKPLNAPARQFALLFSLYIGCNAAQKKAHRGVPQEPGQRVGTAGAGGAAVPGRA